MSAIAEHRRHRRTCICHDPDVVDEIDRQICIAHGTAVHIARQAIAAVRPKDWTIAADIGEVEWHRAAGVREELRLTGRPTWALDIYIAVVRELLPRAQQHSLDRKIRAAARPAA